MGRVRDKQIETALRSTKGRISAAAHMLGCSRPTIYAHIQKSPRLARIFEEIKEDFECEILDTAEAALLLAITNGEPWAIKKALDSKGKQRGWGDTSQVEFSGPNGGPIEMKHERQPISESERLAELVALCESIRARATTAAGSSEDAE